MLDDPILVRTGDGMRPTPRALALRPAVRAALTAAEQVLQAAPAFDPATAQRTFTIVAVDQIAQQLFPSLAARLLSYPGIRLHAPPAQSDRMTEHLATEVDLALGVFRDAPANVLDQKLWAERFVCVVRKGSPAARGPFDLARYLALPHLFVAPRGLPGSPLDDVLAKKGHTRTIALTVPQFLVAPHIVAATDLVWTAPSRLAEAFAEYLPLTIREVPFSLPGFTVSARWHARLDRDPGLAWLREQLLELAPAT